MTSAGRWDHRLSTPSPHHLADVVSVRARAVAGSFKPPCPPGFPWRLLRKPLVGGPFPHAHQLAQPWCGAAKEAKIAGVPVITANQGGMKELVREGIVGLSFLLGDPQNLPRVLLDVIEDPSQLQAMRLEAPEVPTIEA